VLPGKDGPNASSSHSTGGVGPPRNTLTFFRVWIINIIGIVLPSVKREIRLQASGVRLQEKLPLPTEARF
jgi:hypothetical protein